MGIVLQLGVGDGVDDRICGRDPRGLGEQGFSLQRRPPVDQRRDLKLDGADVAGVVEHRVLVGAEAMVPGPVKVSVGQ